MWLQKIFVFTLIILSIIYGSYANDDKNGYSIPTGDLNLEYGKDEINVTCVITNEEVKEQRMRDPSSLNFTFCIGKDFVPESQIIRINETVIRYVNKSPKMMSMFLGCVYYNYSIALNSIVVGSKPHNVTDFDCIGYNLENLTCSWTPDLKALYAVKYTLTYYYNNKTQRTTECGEYTKENNKTLCVFSTRKQPYYRPSHDIIYFILNGSNFLGENIQTFEIEHYKKIKTSPPANLRVENSTVSSLYLSWDIPDNMVKTHVSLEHNITYTFNNKYFYMGKVFSTSCDSKRIYANLTDLPYAYVLYNVRVYMRLNDTDATDMWSKKAFIIHLTNGALPGAPIANRRAFYNEGLRVVIYWSQVDALYRNGANLTYIVYCKTKSYDLNVTTTNGYYELNNLNTNREHIFEIRSENHVGKSLNYSEIVIPPLYNPEMEMDSPVLKEYSETKYGLSWSPPSKGAEHLVNYTVYWCESSKRAQFHLCSNIEWATVPANETSYIIPVSRTNNIDMAISANGKRESTSMKWSQCVVRHDDNLLHKPSFVLNDATPSTTSITISWKLRCMEISKKIKNYVIEYCEVALVQTCLNPTKIIRLPMSSIKETSYTIKNLESYTTYRVGVYMEDSDGSSSLSEQTYVTTLEGRPPRPINLNITKVTNNSITFEWSLPQKPISKVIREIKVKYNNLYKNVAQAIQTGTDDSVQTQNFTLTDLLSYETYNISISACIDECSDYSDVVSARTKVGQPSRIDKVNYYSLNTSITWEKPIQPAGTIDYYELVVSLDEKPLHKDPQRVNTTMHILNKCSDTSPYGTVSYKVRAVNIGEDGEIYMGDWSKEDRQRCQKVKDYTVTIAISFALFLILIMGFVFVVFGKKCYVYIITMKDVQFQLPDGLYENKDRFPRGNELDCMKEPQGDDQFLLDDKDGIKRSGDSSGCSSGQDSAESDSGTSLGSSSDSGTEQPRTKDDDHLVEAVPLEDFSLSTSGNGPTTYCQLGYPSSHSDSKEMTPFSFPKVDIPLIIGNETPGSDISPYIRCEQVESRSINPGYVANPIPTSGYVPHTVEEKKSGYVPHPSVEKNTGYVMAAEKNSLISPSNENKGYVQVADVSNSQMLNNENLPRTNGYVSYGDVKSLPASPEMKATSAYVPHKQLDEVLNK
ncbi:cytokine receptor [Onthophagus taurus]|uniref:cytokine receptor n=1 Tax=Onthophagus taurus TaxID=166361 RepID=UPI0039BE76AC